MYENHCTAKCYKATHVDSVSANIYSGTPTLFSPFATNTPSSSAWTLNTSGKERSASNRSQRPSRPSRSSGTTPYDGTCPPSLELRTRTQPPYLPPTHVSPVYQPPRTNELMILRPVEREFMEVRVREKRQRQELGSVDGVRTFREESDGIDLPLTFDCKRFVNGPPLTTSLMNLPLGSLSGPRPEEARVQVQKRDPGAPLGTLYPELYQERSGYYTLREREVLPV